MICISVILLVSAGALEDDLRQYNLADLFSYAINLFRPQTKKNIHFLVVLCIFAFSL